MKKIYFTTCLAIALACATASAQELKIKGIGHANRYDDGEQMLSKYVGYNSALQKAIFVVDQSIYAMTWNGLSLSTATKEPEVNIADFYSGGKYTDNDKALWANNFNMLYANSGAVYVDGMLVTVMSRDEQSTPDESLFNVRKWDATTGELLSSEVRPKSDCLESAGMSYNPVDGKVYGLFYLTAVQLPEEITSDPDYFVDEDDDMTDGDAGYCLCSIDLDSMKVTPITPGIYYQNFITFAINSEGRAFALTSGGGAGYTDADGKLRNADNQLVGAQLCEFDLKTGIMIQNATTTIDPETAEEYTEYTFPVPPTGYSSQYKRQAACFAKSNPNKMYWVGYYNSGKGYNSWGSWSSLPDRDSATGQTWRDNGKYDTALYEVDVNTGEATRLSKITNRWIFSALWIDGDDASDNATPAAVKEVKTVAKAEGCFNLSGQSFAGQPTRPGIYVVNTGGKTRKVVIK